MDYLQDYLLSFAPRVTTKTQAAAYFDTMVLLAGTPIFYIEHLAPSSPQLPLGRIAIRYRTILLDTFKFVAKRVKSSKSSAELDDFYCSILAVLYFRVPLLGSWVIDSLTCMRLPDAFPDGFLLGDCERTADFSRFVANNPSLFDWVLLFDEQALDVGMVEPSMLDKLHKSPAVFSRFIKALVRHVRLVSEGPIFWQAIPGYDVLVHAFTQFLEDYCKWIALSCAEIEGHVSLSLQVPASPFFPSSFFSSGS